MFTMHWALQYENSTGTIHPNGPRNQLTTNVQFTTTNDTQSLEGANLDVMQTMDFLIALILDGKKSRVLFKNNAVVFGRLFKMMDCPKHSLAEPNL